MVAILMISAFGAGLAIGLSFASCIARQRVRTWAIFKETLEFELAKREGAQ